MRRTVKITELKPQNADFGYIKSIFADFMQIRTKYGFKRTVKGAEIMQTGTDVIYEKAYQQGRADAIEEFVKYYEKGDCVSCDKPESEEDFVCIKCMAEKFKLKEQKNE